MKKICKISLKNLRLKTIIGFLEKERSIKQEVVINVSFKYDASEAIDNDNIDYAINYKTITKAIIHKTHITAEIVINMDRGFFRRFLIFIS